MPPLRCWSASSGEEVPWIPEDTEWVPFWNRVLAYLAR